MGDFDPTDENSWYFGMVPREESTSILQTEKDSGVFLVRDSGSIHGDFVLCVKEETKISNYIINKIQTNGRIMYRIGEYEFENLAALLSFYKIHYLDTTTLIKPARRQKFIGLRYFTARDKEDLPFKAGEVLTLLRKDNDDWWTMQNSQGVVGTVPVKLIDRYDETTERRSHASDTQSSQTEASQPMTPRALPAIAHVIRKRVPCAYVTTDLHLEVGDEITVEAMHATGQWEGVVKGKRGFFPCTYIKFPDENDKQPAG